MMVARTDINANCATFKPTQLRASANLGSGYEGMSHLDNLACAHSRKWCTQAEGNVNSPKCNNPAPNGDCSFTAYHEPTNIAGLSIRLCKPDTARANTCNPSNPIKRDTFNNVGFRTNKEGSVRSEVAMFNWAQTYVCVNRDSTLDAHDSILAISRWTPSGNGAFVRQFIFRAHGWKNATPETYTYGGASVSYYTRATVSLTGSGPEILVCRDGFGANANGNDCVPNDFNQCCSPLQPLNKDQLYSGIGNSSEQCWTKSGNDFKGCFCQ
ncbi:MAG: hypothetical protein FWG39_02160 [Alphaproteobacteria bacterium]|nr:hypothetical protein [Alphaproteobacteria bacterium]